MEGIILLISLPKIIHAIESQIPIQLSLHNCDLVTISLFSTVTHQLGLLNARFERINVFNVKENRKTQVNEKNGLWIRWQLRKNMK